ncbi:hypothetical protein DICPUDRAFT_99321 [Dictyostelium purpureum]|uniref:PH domain-containing protein n=1 Tax=Dictyostelium purpureum TaxID=5786 RepID=F0ZY71_DICPU|nr:uncharacterized protein DICPUDRAFT_99321 [Dictyostelium purpureum]EGC31117.1 hypothetical protein DICPUDRAFT_99321 [Dictyostelium purpureum]|eukprot:XP_003292366.1 hypothetical protein DICPUDRAFT_99321 [Dictyostelium purpureum]
MQNNNINSESVQGFLCKKGNKSLLSSASWKKRWFILVNAPTNSNDNDNILLKYYKNQNDESPKGFILLSSIESIDSVTTAVTVATSNSTTNKYFFNIKTKNRIYNLYSDTEQERDYWILNLNISIVKLNDNDKSIKDRPRSYTLPTPQPTLIVQNDKPVNNSNNNNNNNNSKPPLPPKPLPQPTSSPSLQSRPQSQTQKVEQIPIPNSNNINNNNNNNKPPIEFIEDENISLCGAKIKDSLKNHSNGYITCMVAVTRSKIWTGDSQGNIVTWTISRTGATDKLKKGSQWKPHTSVTALIYVPSQKLVYSSGLDNKICSWNRTDFSPVFTHISKFPIYDMVFSKNDLIVYCGGTSSSSSSSSPIEKLTSNIANKDNKEVNLSNLSLFDTITKEETEIPFSAYLPSILTNDGKKLASPLSKKRKFIKMVKYDEKIIICTNRAEILIWAPFDNEPCKFISIGESFDITAMDIVGDTLWICTTQDINGNIFSTTLPCVITVLDLATLKKIRSFECHHPISNFSIINGYVWAITRGYITVYEPFTGQLAYETIQLKEDMNFCSLYHGNMVWIGGTFIWRFQIFDNWVSENLEYDITSPIKKSMLSRTGSQTVPDKAALEQAVASSAIINFIPIQDYTDFEYIESTLRKLKERFSLEYSNQLYDILLTIGENDQLMPEYQTMVCKCLRYFGRNKSTLMREFILSDNNRLVRIAQLLQSYLSNKNNLVLIYESLKVIEYLVSSFDKFSKLFQIEPIIKFTTNQPNRLILQSSLNILYRLFDFHSNFSSSHLNSSNSTNSLNGSGSKDVNSSSGNKDSLYNNIKEKVKTFISYLFDSAIDDKTKTAVINIISRYPNELKEQFKKESNIQQIYEILNQGSSLCCNDLIVLFSQILKDSSKIKEMVSKNFKPLLNLLEQRSSAFYPMSPSTSSNSAAPSAPATNDRLRIYYLMTSPSYIQRVYNNSNNGNDGKKIRKQIISSNFQSPVESIIFTLNSILHSLKSTSFKNTKITIIDIILPKEFPSNLDILNQSSIVNVNFVMPTQCFVSTIKFKFNPKDVSIKLLFENALSSGEATISNLSVSGEILLGFEIGTAKPQYIQFIAEPEILFDTQTTGVVVGFINLFFKSILKKTIKSKFVAPNKFYLPSI